MKKDNLLTKLFSINGILPLKEERNIMVINMSMIKTIHYKNVSLFPLTLK